MFRTQEVSRSQTNQYRVHPNLELHIFPMFYPDYAESRRLALNNIKPEPDPNKSPNKFVSNRFGRSGIIVTEEGVLQRESQINLEKEKVFQCFSAIKDACKDYADFVGKNHQEVNSEAISESMFKSFANILVGVGEREHELNFFISVPYPENARLDEIAEQFQTFLSRIAKAFEIIGLYDFSLKINEFIERPDQSLTETVLQLVFKVAGSTPLDVREKISNILNEYSDFACIAQSNENLDQLYQDFKKAGLAGHIVVGSARVAYLIASMFLTTLSDPLELSRIYYGLLLRQVEEMQGQLPVAAYQISATKIGDGEDGELTSRMLEYLYKKLPQDGQQTDELSLLKNVALFDSRGFTVYLHLLTVMDNSESSESLKTIKERELPEDVYFAKAGESFELQVVVDEIDLTPQGLLDSLPRVCETVAGVTNIIFDGSSIGQLRIQQFSVRKGNSPGALHIIRAAGRNKNTWFELEQIPRSIKGPVKINMGFWGGITLQQKGEVEITSSQDNDPSSLYVLVGAIKAFVEYFFGNTDSPDINANYLQVIVPAKYEGKVCKNFQLYIYSLCQEVLAELLYAERIEQNTLTYQFCFKEVLSINGKFFEVFEENSHYVRPLVTAGYNCRPVKNTEELFKKAVSIFCQELQKLGFLSQDFELTVNLLIESPGKAATKITVEYP